ncbi:MAG: serine protease [Steroidobacteraceae bacterium]|jgi:trypsin-like peptidase
MTSRVKAEAHEARAVEQPPTKRFDELTKAIVGVGKPSEGGRGFVVEIDRQRMIITAAHCLQPSLPPAHPASYLEERTYKALLAPLGAEPTVSAECLFADPIADVAVLGSPDNQVLADEAEAYEALVDGVTPLAIVAAPKLGRKRVQLRGDGRYGGSFWVDTPWRGFARLLSLDGKWFDCAMTRHRVWLSIDHEELVAGGMSGSPVISMDGGAIGVVSTAEQNPILRECLPGRFLHGRRQRLGASS